MNDPQARLIADAERRLGAKSVVTERQEVEPWLTDWRGRAQARQQLAPASTEEVAEIVRLAAEYRVPLVPRAGTPAWREAQRARGWFCASCRCGE